MQQITYLDGMKAYQGIVKYLVLILWMLIWCAPLSAQEMDIMTFNIRYANPDDGEDYWEYRKDDVVDLIAHYNPVAVGIQEGLLHQVNYLQEGLSNYKMIGVGRDDGKSKGEFAAIFYDTTRLALIEHETFWLSETPYEISVGWDASMERICTYGLFEEIISGNRLFIFNAHFDHKGAIARLNSAGLILNEMESKNSIGYPVVLMGDLNCELEDPPMEVISNQLKDPLKVAHLYGPKGTWNEFDSSLIANRRIDYIFTSGLGIQKYRHVDDRRPNGRMISDHYPVLATFQF